MVGASLYVAPVPQTFASVFRPDATTDGQIQFHGHSSSWAGMKTGFTWDSFSQCTIALIDVPTANLWSQSKSRYEVIDPEGIVIKEGTVDGTMTFAVQLTQPLSHTLRVVSNEASKEFEFSPPISFQLVESEEPSEPPSVHITPNANFTGSSSIEWEGVVGDYDFENKRAFLNDQGSPSIIQLPRSWYASLETVADVKMRFGNFTMKRPHSISVGFEPTYQFNLDPPPISWFKPYEVSSTILMNPDGMILDIELEGLAPSIEQHEMSFILDSGKIVSAVQDGRIARVEFTTAEEIADISGFVQGRLNIEPYHSDGADEGLHIRQKLTDNIEITTNPVLFRDNSEETCLAINRNGNWNGSIRLTLIPPQDNVQLDNGGHGGHGGHEGHEVCIDLGIGNLSFTPFEIRNRLPAIDDYFFRHVAVDLTIRVECTPYPISGLFPTEETSFALRREEILIQPPIDEVSSCLENGEQIEWKVDYILGYYPDPYSFKLMHCGREIPATVVNGDLYFKFDQPSYEEYSNDNSWRLLYDQVELQQGECTMPTISLRRYITELTYILDPDIPFCRASPKVEIETNNQHDIRCRLHIFKSEEDSPVDSKEFVLVHGKVSKEIDDWIEEMHKNDEAPFDLASSTQWRLEISLPSRVDETPLLSVDISTKDKEGMDTTAVKRNAREFLDRWAGDPKDIREIQWYQLHKEVCLILGQHTPDYLSKHFQQRKLIPKLIELTEKVKPPYWNKLLRFMKVNGWHGPTSIQEGLEELWREKDYLEYHEKFKFSGILPSIPDPEDTPPDIANQSDGTTLLEKSDDGESENEKNKTVDTNRHSQNATKATAKQPSSVSSYYNNANPNATGIRVKNAPSARKSRAPAAKAKAVPPTPEVKSNPILDKPKTIETTSSPEQAQSPEDVSPEPSKRVVSEEERKVEAKIEEFRRDFKHPHKNRNRSMASDLRRNFGIYRGRYKSQYPNLEWKDLSK
jgi:hypothetical protein